jgi:hypothetical protein
MLMIEKEFVVDVESMASYGKLAECYDGAHKAQMKYIDPVMFPALILITSKEV